MSKLVIAALAGATVLGCAAGAPAAVPRARIQGQIESLAGDALTVKAYSGRTVELTLGPQTHYEAVVPARLSTIKKGDYIGIGATGPANHLTALEVHIFPAAMRGVGEGIHPWSLPAAIANADRGHAISASAKGMVHGTMANGTVMGGSAQGAPPVRGTMANGTVAASGRSAGDRVLTLSAHGKTAAILVPASAPVVRMMAAGRSDLKPGAKIFALASKNGAALDADNIAVGKNGLMPPM